MNLDFVMASLFFLFREASKITFQTLLFKGLAQILTHYIYNKVFVLNQGLEREEFHYKSREYRFIDLCSIDYMFCSHITFTASVKLHTTIHVSCLTEGYGTNYSVTK